MTYIPFTEEVRFDASFYDGMGGPITPEGFNLWLLGVIRDAFEQGIAYEGTGSSHPLEEAAEEILGEWLKK